MRVAISRLALILALLFVAPLRGDVDKYEVYAVRFATIANFRVAIVDSGFHREQYFRQFAVKDYIKPSDAIAPLGLKPESVTDLIVSHMHWDHAGGIDLFPSARVWIQKDEYDYYTGDAWQSPNTHGGIDPDDVQAIVKRNIAGKVSFVRGDDETTISGLSFNVGGKHTWASQYVGVQTPKSTVVIASDNMYLYENLDAHKPIAQTLDAVSNLRAQDRMRSLASEPRFVIPGHDAAVFERFPHVSDRIVRIE